MKNWHAQKLGATSKKVYNIQAITRTRVKTIAYWY